MGNLKDEALKTGSEDIQQFKLTEPEVAYLRLLNLALQYHTLGQKIMSGFLYYICTTRLGYKDGTSLQFEFNFDNQDNMLTVKLLSNDAPVAPAPPAAAAAPAAGQTPPAPASPAAPAASDPTSPPAAPAADSTPATDTPSKTADDSATSA